MFPKRRNLCLVVKTGRQRGQRGQGGGQKPRCVGERGEKSTVEDLTTDLNIGDFAVALKRDATVIWVFRLFEGMEYCRGGCDGRSDDEDVGGSAKEVLKGSQSF